jgi:hypothetical protein
MCKTRNVGNVVKEEAFQLRARRSPKYVRRKNSLNFERAADKCLLFNKNVMRKPLEDRRESN